MRRNKIAAVCYLNTIPFVYGITHAESILRADLLLDIPSRCAANFSSGKADIALVPVADLRYLTDYKIITPYCIGASCAVRTVALFSNIELDKIKTIYLDSHSHTSATLIKVLASELWHITPEWRELNDFNIIDSAEDSEAFLLIGDKVFEHEAKFAYSFDFAIEWHKLTSMPFVFAVWVARNSVSKEVIVQLSKALEFGVTHIEEAIKNSKYSDNYSRNFDYLTNNISFNLDDDKIKALHTFLQKIPPSPSIL